MNLPFTLPCSAPTSRGIIYWTSSSYGCAGVWMGGWCGLVWLLPQGPSHCPPTINKTLESLPASGIPGLHPAGADECLHI